MRSATMTEVAVNSQFIGFACPFEILGIAIAIAPSIPVFS